MIHTEHFRRADTTYELRADNKGNATHAFIKDGEVKLFNTLYEFCLYDSGEVVDVVYLSEGDYNLWCEGDKYSFIELKEFEKQLIA